MNEKVADFLKIVDTTFKSSHRFLQDSDIHIFVISMTTTVVISLNIFNQTVLATGLYVKYMTKSEQSPLMY